LRSDGKGDRPPAAAPEPARANGIAARIREKDFQIFRENLERVRGIEPL
tara:strand:+ start:304 stop:450 length:147 start_codon:yes stop_codon:yes gene_type:complete